MPDSKLRTNCLKTADCIINGYREEDYGTPERNFDKIAALWSAHLSMEITPLDVAAMMCLLKIARIGTGKIYKEDNWIDIAGYAALGYEIGCNNQ